MEKAYLALPFGLEKDKRKAWEMAVEACAFLVDEGFSPRCPIVEGFPVSLKTPAKGWWTAWEKPCIAGCDLFVLLIPPEPRLIWKSPGIQRELAFALRKKKPLALLFPMPLNLKRVESLDWLKAGGALC